MEGRNKAKKSFSVLSPDMAKFNPTSAVGQFSSSPSLPGQLWRCSSASRDNASSGDRRREINIGIMIFSLIEYLVDSPLTAEAGGE